MKDTFYFTHDYNTRSDSKVTKLLAKHGMRGYGLFWSIIEDLYNNANVLRLDYDCLAYALREDGEVIKSVIHDFDLFVFEDGNFGSKSVQNRLEERNAKSEKARNSAIKRWKDSERNANALPTQSEGNAIKESKVNETKETNEIIESNSDGFDKPIVDDPKHEKEMIDFDGLLKLINITFDKQYKKIPDPVRKSFVTRFTKDKYTKDQFRLVLTNCLKDPFAKQQKYNFCTPEYLSRVRTFEKYLNFDTNIIDIKKPEEQRSLRSELK